MDDSILQKHTAGSKSLGFDYQFYYFVYLLLGLRQGEKIGYEIKDDIHIEKADGSIFLIQAKHTTQLDSQGEAKSLTSLDVDMWKTIDIWATFIKSQSIDNVKKHHFVLLTNKTDKGNNEFINIVMPYQSDSCSIDNVKNKITTILQSTTDKIIQQYIKNVLSISNEYLEIFIKQLIFETGNDSIIANIKDRLKERLMQTDNALIDSIFEQLLSNINTSKYTEIKQGSSFELTFEDFISRYGQCFRVAFENKPLPKRKFDYIPPDDIEQQTFIKQLLDIGDVTSNSPDVIDYATQMYQALNQIQFWAENNYVLPTEMDEFETNAICIWKNEFKAKYRAIHNKFINGENLESLESDIKSLALDLVDFIRSKNLVIHNNNLSVEESNGYFYVLSDKPKIGWHFNWKEKYK